MDLEFDDEFNRRIYAEWHQPLLDRMFGDRIDLHHDIYLLTHAHRRQHNGGKDEGLCTAWPSPPYRGPVWWIIAEMIGAKRFLEVGTGLGYTTALLADAGGTGCQVDTIEIDPWHADLAQAELSKKGLIDRVRILRGDADQILPTLTEKYDVVFADGGEVNIALELRRLTRRGGISPEVKELLREPLISTLLRFREGPKVEGETIRVAEARQDYINAVREIVNDHPVT